MAYTGTKTSGRVAEVYVHLSVLRCTYVHLDAIPLGGATALSAAQRPSKAAAPQALMLQAKGAAGPRVYVRTPQRGRIQTQEKGRQGASFMFQSSARGPHTKGL